MKELWRLWRLFRGYRGHMALGVILSLVTLLANVGLLAMSGWFISAMAVAGAAQVSMNYFTPAAFIRACAILRTGGRYLERLVTHEATLRLLSSLRVWFYGRLEPLAPACLQRYHSGDLLSRIRAGLAQMERIDTLSRELIHHQDRMSRLTGLSQGAFGLAANLTLWLGLWVAIPLANHGRLAPAEFAMLTLFVLASFEAIMPLPAAFQHLGATLTAAYC